MTAKGTHGAMPDREELINHFRRKYGELHDQSMGHAPPGSLEGRGPWRLESVIVPLDGGRYAEHALPIAGEIAAGSTASLFLESDSLFGRTFDPLSHSFEEASCRRRQTRLHAYLKDLTKQGSPRAFEAIPRLRTLPVAAESPRTVAKEGGLVVLAQRPCRMMGSFSMGHAVEQLLKDGSSPLLLVRGYSWPYALRPAKKTNRMLIVLDGTAKSESILPAAMAIAEAVGAQMTLLRIIPGMPYYGIPWAEKETEAKAYLEQVGQAIQRRGITAELAVWSSNEPVGQVILSYAVNNKADLIAMATGHRRTPLGPLWRPPMHYLFRKSRIPLLIVGTDNGASRLHQLAKAIAS